MVTQSQELILYIIHSLTECLCARLWCVGTWDTDMIKTWSLTCTGGHHLARKASNPLWYHVGSVLTGLNNNTVIPPVEVKNPFQTGNP